MNARRLVALVTLAINGAIRSPLSWARAWQAARERHALVFPGLRPGPPNPLPRTRHRWWNSWRPAVALLAVVSCGEKKPPQVPEPPVTQVVTDAGAEPVEDAAPPPSLFDRIGGADGIKQIVEKLVENVTQDPAVSKTFKVTKGPRLEAFKKNLAEQICELTGGPCKYAGKDMKGAHKGMKLTEAQFEAFMTDFQLAMSELKVGEADQSEVTAKLAPIKDEMVEAKPKGPIKK
jgi:hemoglobin